MIEELKITPKLPKNARKNELFIVCFFWIDLKEREKMKIRGSPLRVEAKERAAKVLRDYQGEHPAAMRSFNDDLQACLVYLRCPLAHHKSIRTTNLLERAFQESWRRTKVIPHFFTEKACLKLVFSALWKTSQRWRKVTMNALDQQQLELLRKELDLPLYNR